MLTHKFDGIEQVISTISHGFNCMSLNYTVSEQDRKESRYFYILSTLKYKIKYTPTFFECAFIAKQQSCVMCQIEK